MLVTFGVVEPSDETASIFRTSNFTKVANLPADADNPRSLGFSWQWVRSSKLIGKCNISKSPGELAELTAAEKESDAGIEKTELAIYDSINGEVFALELPKEFPPQKVVELGKVRNDGYVQVWNKDSKDYVWLRLE
jgi:hypothetical protein